MFIITKTEKWIAIVLFFVWAIVVWLFGIGKLVSDGTTGYLIHFTNWSWTLQALFFTFDLIFLLNKNGSLTFYLVSIFFWLVNGVTWSVFWLIFIVLGNNPDLLIDVSDRGTGTHSLGFILDMDRVFHVLPAVMILFYIFLRRDKIAFTVFFFMNPSQSTFITAFVYGLVNMLAPIALALAYFSTNDVEEVYGLTISIAYVIGVALVVLILFNFVPLMIFYAVTTRKRKTTKRLLEYCAFIQSGYPLEEGITYKPYDNTM